MRITVPYRGNNSVDTFIEFKILYDVVATAGPPGEADFGINYTGFQFVELWCYDDLVPGGVVIIEDSDDYLDSETGGANSPYDREIRAYIEDNEGMILESCREFELTNA